MGRYVALLRGINVGGKNLIKMTELKGCFEDHGFRNVATYIQSGNVLFESGERSSARLAQRAIESVSTKEGVDQAYAGTGVLYFSRLISKASQSRLSRIVSMPIYQSMTIRNWNTTLKLLEMI